jgi:hypothetical protein
MDYTSAACPFCGQRMVVMPEAQQFNYQKVPGQPGFYVVGGTAGKSTKNKAKWWVLAFGVIGLLIVLAGMHDYMHPELYVKQQQQDPPTKTAPSAPSVSSISWSQVDAIYNVKSKTTDMQKEDAWKRFKGQRVVWTGEVSEVSSGMLGGVSLQIKMNPDTFTSDLIISMKKSERDKASSLSKGSRVTFSGVLNNGGTILPITLDDGEIVR